MARQLFQDGPFVDPPVAAIGANATNTITPLWVAASFTPIFANDPKAGKIYCVRAGGIITSGTAGSTMIITPKYGTGGTALGASPAQAMPACTNIPWTLEADLVFRTIGAAGANSTCVLVGKFCMQGTIATNGAGTVIPFGGTVASVDATINSALEFNSTMSAGSNSIQPQFAYIFSRN